MYFIIYHLHYGKIEFYTQKPHIKTYYQILSHLPAFSVAIGRFNSRVLVAIVLHWSLFFGHLWRAEKALSRSMKRG